MKILVTATSLREDLKIPAMDRLRAFADELVFNKTGRPLAPEELIPMLGGVDGVIAGIDRFDESVISAAPESLKVISRTGVGYDRIDLRAAARRGIAVTNTPGANSNAVADLALGLMLCAARKIPVLDRGVREGGWPRSTGIDLYGKTVGIVGLGAIGKGVARRAQGFSMRVLAFDPYADAAYAARSGIELVPFGELIERSDFITLHVPLTPETRHMIGAGEIARMKPGAILINTSRGGLIDEQAAYEALAAGRLGGMGLDAYETEPPGSSPLFALDSVVATPHTGAHTREASENMANMAVDNLIDVLSGRPCPYLVSVKD